MLWKDGDGWSNICMKSQVPDEMLSDMRGKEWTRNGRKRGRRRRKGWREIIEEDRRVELETEVGALLVLLL